MKIILNFIDKKLEEIILVWGTMVMTLLIFFQVISRYIFNVSLAWSEEISRYLFIWTVWLAVPYAVVKGRHIRLTVLRDIVGDTGKFIMDMIFFVASIIFFIYVGVLSVSLTEKIFKLGQLTPAVGIPKWFCYMALPTGCLLGGGRFIQYAMLKVIRYIRNPSDNETFKMEVE